ncbi:hypothetical protein B0H13DRAFT_1862186 [Mycena leptocephala]|nr:hypothetical protein B0H13DRAFT_1862186 [Mycena leptocephala]
MDSVKIGLDMAPNHPSTETPHPVVVSICNCLDWNEELSGAISRPIVTASLLAHPSFGRLQNACGMYLGSRDSWSAASSKNHLDPANANTGLDCIDLVDWQTSIRWMQLTTLELLFCGVDRCLEMLGHTPNLEPPGTPPDLSLPSPYSSPPSHRGRGIRMQFRHSRLSRPPIPRPRGPVAYQRMCSTGDLHDQKIWIFATKTDMHMEHAVVVQPQNDTPQRRSGDSSFGILFKTIAENSYVLPAFEAQTITECPTSTTLLIPMVEMLVARTVAPDGTAKLKVFGLAFAHQEILDLKIADEEGRNH